MDIAPYADLQDFIDSLDVKDRKVEAETVRKEEEDIGGGGGVAGDGTEEVERRRDDVWQSIADGANDWSRRLVDAECLHTRSSDFRSNIENSLYRQQLDGFLSIRDMADLHYITDLWVELLNTLSSYQMGCIFLKRNVIYVLLKLHSVKQISEELFIETCLQLWQLVAS